MSIHTDELARELADCEDISISAAARCIQSLNRIIIGHLRQDREVRLYGLGTFQPKTRKCRVGWNPRTGEKMIIPDRPVVRFKASKRLYKDQATAIPLPVTPVYPELDSGHASD